MSPSVSELLKEQEGKDFKVLVVEEPVVMSMWRNLEKGVALECRPGTGRGIC